MLLPLLVLSVFFMAAFLGQGILRRGGRDRRPYALLLLADAAIALVSFLALRQEPAAAGAGALGAVAIGAFVCLVVLPPALRDLAGRAIGRERLGLADRLLAACELLQPGGGARQEREVLAIVRDVRAGRTDAALAELRARRGGVDAVVRRRLDERIAFTLLYARRWRPAIDHFEGAFEASEGAASPQLLVEMIRAYGEAGDLDRAARLLERIEALHAGGPARPLLGFLVVRARTIFLAFAGQPAAVEAILATAGASLPPAARSYWIGVARLRGGDRDGARHALAAAVEASGPDARARQIAVETLLAADRAPAERAPLSPEVASLAERIEHASAGAARAAAAVPRLQGSALRLAPVTVALVAANVGVAVAVTVLLGSTEQPGILADAGANVKAAVRAGEWWRLVASTFLHVGVLHLAINLYALWILGRLTEQILGHLRFLVLYLLSGLGGSLASFLFGHGEISAGASGAVFGVLGAAIADLALHRHVYPEAWRRALLGNLVFVALANLAVGVFVPLVDQSAHLGGLVVGAAIAGLLAPRGRVATSPAGRPLAALLAGVAIASLAHSAVATAGRFLLEGWVRRDLGAVSIEVPARWILMREGNLYDPRHAAVLRVASGDDDAVGGGPGRGDESPSPAEGWEAWELSVVVEDAPVPGAYRAIRLARGEADLELLVPERHLDAVRARLGRILESARARNVGPGAGSSPPAW